MSHIFSVSQIEFLGKKKQNIDVDYFKVYPQWYVQAHVCSA